jgi:hypothetical protein
VAERAGTRTDYPRADGFRCRVPQLQRLTVTPSLLLDHTASLALSSPDADVVLFACDSELVGNPPGALRDNHGFHAEVSAEAEVRRNGGVPNLDVGKPSPGYQQPTRQVRAIAPKAELESTYLGCAIGKR